MTFIIFLVLTVSVSCQTLPKIDVEEIALEKLVDFDLSALLGRKDKLIDFLDDLVEILEKPLKNIEDDKEEFKGLMTHVNSLDDKDFSKWISKTGLGLLDDILERKKENNNYYSAAKQWIKDRFEYSGKLKSSFKTMFSSITNVQKEIYGQIRVIETKIEKIKDCNSNEREKVIGLMKEIEKEINDVSHAKFIIDFMNRIIKEQQDNLLLDQLESIGEAIKNHDEEYKLSIEILDKLQEEVEKLRSN